jgi:hypothetical protein
VANIFDQFDLPGDDDVLSFISETAPKFGIPVEDAVSVWEGEGKGAWQSNYKKGGLREPSYGPYQLLKGGKGTGYPRGLGNAFMEETGLDPADPANWKAATEYALRTAANEGWRQWYGASPALRQRGGYEPMRVSPKQNVFDQFDAPAEAPKRATVPGGPTHGGDLNEQAEVPVPKAVPTWGEAADDYARSAISGITSGVTGLAGLPGEAVKLGETVETYLGLNPKQTLSGLVTGEKGGDEDWTGYVPDTATVDKWVKDNIGNFDYEPKTPMGEAIQGATGFAGAGVGLGSGGKTLLRQGAETAGIAGAAELGEEVGGVPGAITGAILAPSAMGRRTLVGKAPKITEADRVAAADDMVTSAGTEARKRVSQEAYAEADRLGVAIPNNSFQAFQRALPNRPGLQSLGYDPQEHKKLADLLSRISNPLNNMGNAPISFARYDDMRQQVLKVARTAPSSKERMLASRVVDEMDDFFDSATAGSGAKEVVAKARENWRIYRKSQLIDELREGIKDKTGRFSVSGEENATRDQFRSLSMKINRDKRTRNLFTKDEINLIRRLSRGGKVRDALRATGAVLNSPLARALGLGGFGASYGTMDPTYAGLAAGGFVLGKAARGAAGAGAKMGAKRLSKLVQSGGQLTPATNPFVAGLLAINPALGR